VKDDLSHILKSIGDNAQLQVVGRTRQRLDDIRGTGAQIEHQCRQPGVGRSSLIVDATTAAINRSGKPPARRACTSSAGTMTSKTSSSCARTPATSAAARTTLTCQLDSRPVHEARARRRPVDDVSPGRSTRSSRLYGAAFEKRYIEYERMADDGRSVVPRCGHSTCGAA
jgi:hypothetical protein